MNKLAFRPKKCLNEQVFKLISVGLRIVIQVNVIKGYHYRASPRLRYKSSDDRLKDEPRVGNRFAKVWSPVILIPGFQSLTIDCLISACLDN